MRRLHEVLQLVENHGELGIGDLAARMNISPQAARVYSSRLHALGLLRRIGGGRYRRTEKSFPYSPTVLPDTRLGPELEQAFTVETGLAAVITTDDRAVLLLPGMTWPGLGAFTDAQLDELGAAEIHLHLPDTQIDLRPNESDPRGWVASIMLQIATQHGSAAERIRSVYALIGFLPAAFLMTCVRAGTPGSYHSALYRSRQPAR